MKTNFTREEAERFFDSTDQDIDPEKAGIIVSYDDEDGAMVFGHGNYQGLIVCLAAAVAHMSSQMNTRPSEIFREARKVLELQGLQPRKRMN